MKYKPNRSKWKLHVVGAVADSAVTESSSAAPSPTPDLSSILGALATFGGSLGGNSPDGPARLDGAAGDFSLPPTFYTSLCLHRR